MRAALLLQKRNPRCILKSMCRRALLLCVPVLALAANVVLGPIGFEEIADSAGVHFVINNSATPLKQQPEGLIAGVALFDRGRREVVERRQHEIIRFLDVEGRKELHAASTIQTCP